MILFLIIFIALSISPASAQPQAPITWSETRLLRQVSYPPYRTGEVFCHGDTVALVNRDFGNGQNYPAVSVSGDNGGTWSPWYHFSGPNYETATRAIVGFTSTAVFATAPTDDYLRGIYVTTDLGGTWQRPQDSLCGLYFMCQRGDTLFCWMHDQGGIGTTWTADLGRTFAPPRYAGWEIAIYGLAASAATLHAIGNEMGDSSTYRLRYTRAPLLDGPFEPTRILNPDTAGVTVSHIACDDSGTVMILSAVDYEGSLSGFAMWLNISRDDGLTWSPADTLTPYQSCGHFSEDVLRCGHLWLLYWADSTTSPGFERGGTWCRFSANNGRSWYPNQQVEGADWSAGRINGGYLGPDWARLHVACNVLDGVTEHDYLQWTGQIRRDSLAPLWDQVTVLPELVPVDTTVASAATASDNDSLWRMEVVVHRRWEAPDSTVIALDRTADGSFEGDWRVPVDTAQYVYYYRAEDMWENVSYCPAAGPADPYVVHVGAITAADPFILHPSSFILSVFPNPVNNVAVIELQLPSFAAEAQLELYDLLGRRVYENTIHNASGTTRVFLDVSSWPSGLYFVKAICGTRQVHQKLLVLK
jgi:hypothetical protein